MTSGEWNDDDAASPSLHFFCADDGCLGVVATLDDDIGLESFDELERCVFRKNNNEVDAFERGKNVRALGRGADRARWSFKPSHRLVAVDSDHQRVTRGPRGCEQIDVTGMKKVEDSVRENDAVIPAGPPNFRIIPAGNLLLGLPWSQSLLTAIGWK